MRVLAIDTALEACSVAVLDTDRPDLRAHESLPMQRGHAEALMPLVARVLDRVQFDFSAIDRVAVTTGPGSFTGLRVGIAAARGITITGGHGLELSRIADGADAVRGATREQVAVGAAVRGPDGQVRRAVAVNGRDVGAARGLFRWHVLEAQRAAAGQRGVDRAQRLTHVIDRDDADQLDVRVDEQAPDELRAPISGAADDDGLESLHLSIHLITIGHDTRKHDSTTLNDQQFRDIGALVEIVR